MILIHGPPGVGKTQFFARWPGPHKWFATEPGHKYLPEEQKKGLVRLKLSANAWEDFLQEVTGIQSSCKTIAVDTIGGLFEICMMYVCRKQGWTHPSDAPMGKGWEFLKREFHTGISQLAWRAEEIGATLALISHSKEVEVETPTSKYTRIQVNLTGTARGVIMPVPDHIWFMGFAEGDRASASLAQQTGKRCIFMDGNEDVEAKCRDPRIKERFIVLKYPNQPYQHIEKVINSGNV